MTEEEKENKEEVFMEWTTFIEDRVDNWNTNLSQPLALTWGENSLTEIERYLLDEYSIDSIKDEKNKIGIDALASYIGDVFRKNIPESYWAIEINDDTSIYYNMPVVVFKLGVPVSPHFLIRDSLKENSGQLLERIFNKRKAKVVKYLSKN